MTPRLIVSSLALIAIAILPAPSSAQTTEKAASKIKLVTLDLAVPDSPAFALLGLSPESITRPGSPRDLATTLLNGLDRHGNLQSGLAVDFAPRFLFGGNSLTYLQYHDHKATRLAARTQVSLATAKGASDGDTSVRAAFGLRTTFFDDGDPRMDDDLVKCIDAVVTDPPSTALLTQAARDAYEKAATAARKPKIEACHSGFAKRKWNARSLAVGITPSFQSTTGEANDLDYSGAAIWTSLSLPISKARPAGETGRNEFGQLIVQGRFRDQEQVPNKNVKGAFFAQDSGGIGARLLLGEPDRALVVETEVVRKDPEGAAETTTSFSLSAGGQVKLSTGVWLSVVIGGARSSGTSAEQQGAFVLSSFKWGFSREPAVKVP